MERTVVKLHELFGCFRFAIRNKLRCYVDWSKSDFEFHVFVLA